MIKDCVFYTIGGLGLFLFGMKLMSEGLRAVAGRRLKAILESMTKRAIVAFAIGMAVTAVIQSSSATTVMVIGFVNAGLLPLRQAICVIIGTNVGTTATAWLVSISGLSAFDITSYAMPAIGLGFLMQVAGRARRTKYLGQILLGLSILFLGIEFMKDAFEPLQQSKGVQQLLISVGSQPILAVLAGAAVTMLIQSSSASILIVQVLAMEKAFGTDWQLALNISIPFVLGCNIGTTITAQIAALQTNVNARRVAWAHTLFNVVGTLLAYPLVHFGWYGAFVTKLAPWTLDETSIGSSIAVAHTMFNVANSGVFLPLAGLLTYAVTRLVPEKGGDDAMRPVVLEKHLLDTPEIALEQAKREIVRMARTAQRGLRAAVVGIADDDLRKLRSVRQTEEFTDIFQLEITSYLTSLSSRRLSDAVSVELPVLLHTVNDLERIGDHAVNIVEIAERKMDQKIVFSGSAREEAERLRSEVEQMFERIIASLEEGDIGAARSALENEHHLNSMQVELRRSHVERMRDGLCSPEAGLIFIDLVDNVEKIGDHLTNIAQAVMGGLRWAGVEPEGGLTAVRPAIDSVEDV